MLDIKFIHQNIQLVKEALRVRGDNFDLNQFLELDEKRRDSIKQIDSLREKQNRVNEEIKSFLKEKKDIADRISQMKKISEEIDALKGEFKNIKKEFEAQLINIPNIPHSSAPQGDASCNKIVKSKEPKKFDFKPRNHLELAEYLDIIDFKTASKICGSNFALFKAEGARLERALINFMLDLHTKEHGYKEIFPPFLVNRASMTTTGQLPRLEEDMYALKNDNYFLIPTAEFPLTCIHSNEILKEEKLPLYYVAYTACFRREAGSYGKETRGLMRVHQFDKVELVKFVKPESSYDELEKLLGDALKVIELLELPYRVILLATSEISFAASKCYDIEIYAPGTDKWFEVSSCSNFEAFQSRRGNIKYQRALEGCRHITEYVHTLNGSGVALARLVMAILENYQQEDGSVLIPQVLRRYMDGKSGIAQ